MAINANIYKINWYKLVSWLLPNPLYKPKMFAWCKALVAPISSLHTNFLQFRKQKLYELSITPQVGSLAAMLNKRYDGVQQRIYITNGERGENIYLFQDDEEGADLYIFLDAETQATYVYNDSEVGNNPAHFIVHIPLALAINIDELKALINTYKLPSKRFQIQRF